MPAIGTATIRLCQPVSRDSLRSRISSHGPMATASVGSRPPSLANSPTRTVPDRDLRAAGWRPSSPVAPSPTARRAPSGRVASASMPWLRAAPDANTAGSCHLGSPRPPDPPGRRRPDCRSRRRRAARLRARAPAPRRRDAGPQDRSGAPRTGSAGSGPPSAVGPASPARTAGCGRSGAGDGGHRNGRPRCPPKSRIGRAQLERTQKLELAQLRRNLAGGQRHRSDPAAVGSGDAARAEASREHDHEPRGDVATSHRKQRPAPDRGGPPLAIRKRWISVSCAGCRTTAAASRTG